MSRNPNPEVERQIARLVDGLSSYHEAAIRRALGRVAGLLLGNDATLQPAILGYDLTAVSGGPQQVAFEVPGLFVACSWKAACQFANVNDDPNLLRLTITRQGGAPLIGDSRQGVSLKLIAEQDKWEGLPVPWTILPMDTTMLRVDAETLAGTTRVTFGASGFLVYGASSGGLR